MSCNGAGVIEESLHAIVALVVLAANAQHHFVPTAVPDGIVVSVNGHHYDPWAGTARKAVAGQYECSKLLESESHSRATIAVGIVSFLEVRRDDVRVK